MRWRAGSVTIELTGPEARELYAQIYRLDSDTDWKIEGVLAQIYSKLNDLGFDS